MNPTGIDIESAKQLGFCESPYTAPTNIDLASGPIFDSLTTAEKDYMFNAIDNPTQSLAVMVHFLTCDVAAGRPIIMPPLNPNYPPYATEYMHPDPILHKAGWKLVYGSHNVYLNNETVDCDWREVRPRIPTDSSGTRIHVRAYDPETNEPFAWESYGIAT